MEIGLRESTIDHKNIEDALKFVQESARVCYSEKDFKALRNEELNSDLIKRIIDNGHHQVFEHINLTFDMGRIPKALVMILNNEKQYATCEKSARYTQMKDINPHQKEKYNKWMEKFIPLISKVYPGKDSKKREGAVKKLAQENARYMTSVFTPTNMRHTINLRQLNFLRYEFKDFIAGGGIHSSPKSTFRERLVEPMKKFIEQTADNHIEGLRNQTDRHLSFFGRDVEEHFGDTYSTNYSMSFAALAQAQRHRTISYEISSGPSFKSNLEFFIPTLIDDKRDLKEEWLKDLDEIAQYDFPQAQLVRVAERGRLEDFKSKMILRLCGHAQYEIMQNTLKISKRYAKEIPEMQLNIKPKCKQDMYCAGACVWGGEMALKRVI